MAKNKKETYGEVGFNGRLEHKANKLLREAGCRKDGRPLGDRRGSVKLVPMAKLSNGDVLYRPYYFTKDEEEQDFYLLDGVLYTQ